MVGNPARIRADVDRPEGVLAPSGVSTFRRRFSTPETMELFHEWSGQQVTRLVSNAIRDLALNGPFNPGTLESAAIQYGVSMGLSMAAQLMTDPSVVFPGMFQSDNRSIQMPDMDFSGEPSV